VYAVILAGGGGTRLWPLSRVARPKPFLPLAGERTLLQATVDRVAPLVPATDVHLVADGRYASLVREQLPEVPAGNLVDEPIGRNTAAAVALAAVAIDAPDDAVMAILPADHRIADEAGFRDALAAAADVASDGTFVTLGVQPTGPETGYGYVLARDGERAVGAQEVRAVERFVEKPDRDRAAALIDGGGAYWNAGIFVWRRDAVLAGLAEHAPDILDGVRSSLAADDPADAYAGIRSTSIDYALLEPASLQGRVAVVPIDVGWSDLGSWAALHESLADGDGDASVERIEPGSDAIDVASSGTLVHAAGGRLVVTVGLRDVVVVDTPDAVLVVDRSRAQDVKRVVDRLAAEGRRDRL
jgi:mannose-1-phosphate guanylyltransferase/mannose-6-phosphate isomerase